MFYPELESNLVAEEGHNILVLYETYDYGITECSHTDKALPIENGTSTGLSFTVTKLHIIYLMLMTLHMPAGIES